ncbi:hypothetical protein VNO77_06064 [Canavalia gladiata]|uniref:Uncharacterized protein n=1 Tax=Canavalia gladiata TaxID=3824 RepID=A0AAN9RAK4_CANGL
MFDRLYFGKALLDSQHDRSNLKDPLDSQQGSAHNEVLTIPKMTSSPVRGLFTDHLLYAYFIIIICDLLSFV